MDRVRAHFEKYARRGITLSAVQLAAFCREKNIKFDLATLRKVRHEFKFTALAARYTKPLRYMSSSVAKYGVVMADMAYFMPRHKGVNGGAVGFLCCVECLSGQLAAVPCKNFTTKAWESALTAILESSGIHAITVIVSDRDSAVKSNHASEGLRGRLKSKRGIGWIFLKNRNKAFKVGSLAVLPLAVALTPFVHRRLRE